jgi:hypothetical protein
MKIETLKEAVVFANYDIPAPDMWKNHYEIKYEIPLSSEFWETVEKFNKIKIKEYLRSYFEMDEIITNKGRTGLLKGMEVFKESEIEYLNEISNYIWKLGFGKLGSKTNISSKMLKFLDGVISNKKAKLWKSGSVKYVKKGKSKEIDRRALGNFKSNEIDKFIDENFVKWRFWEYYHQKTIWKKAIHKRIKTIIRDILYDEDALEIGLKKIYNNYALIGEYTEEELKIKNKAKTLSDFQTLKKKVKTKKNKVKILKRFSKKPKEWSKLKDDKLDKEFNNLCEEKIEQSKLSKWEKNILSNLKKGNTYRMGLFRDLMDSGIRVRPIKARSADFWEKLTKKQKKHNKYVWKGIKDPNFKAKNGDGDANGLEDIYEEYPSFKGEYIGEFNDKSRRKEEWAKYEADGRLLRIRWRHRSDLFTDEDKIINPKYWAKYHKAQETGEKVPKHMKKMIPIDQAFISARSTLNNRLSANQEFISNKDSSYILPLDKCLAPNKVERSIDGEPLTKEVLYGGKKIEVPKVYHDPNTPPVHFIWRYKEKTNAFFRKTIEAEFDGYIEGTNKKPPRMPDDPFANTFEEIFIQELMPLYKLLEDYMKKSTEEGGGFKQRFLFGFDKLIKESFDDWFSLYAVKPINYRSFSDLARGLARDWYNQNPDLFKKIQDELEQRYIDYVEDDVLSGYKRTETYIETRRDKRYLRTIDNTYYFADRLTENNALRFIKRFNAMIEVYNSLKNTSHPTLKGDDSYLFKLARYILSKIEWYLTIPNELTNADLEIQEPKPLVKRRKLIESYIHKIEKKIKKEKAKDVEKKQIKQADLEETLRTKGKEGLRSLYKEVIVNKGRFKKPDELKAMIKKLLRPSKSEGEFKKEYEREQRKEEEKRKEEEEEFNTIINDSFFIEGDIMGTFIELRKTITPKQLNDYLEKGKIEEGKSEEGEEWFEAKTEEESEEKTEQEQKTEKILKELEME